MKEKETIELLKSLNNKIDVLQAKSADKKPIEWISKGDLAKMLDCDISTLHNWSVKGKIVPFYLGGRVYYDRYAIDKELLASRIDK